MKQQHADYQVIPYSKLRRLEAIAYRSVQHKPMIHGLLEVDVTRARSILREYKANTGEYLSFTAFLIACLAKAVEEHKAVQAYRKGSKHLILFDEVDVYTPIERDVAGQKQLMPSIIRAANRKTVREIHHEIRAAYRAAHPNASAGDLLAALQSDWYIRIPALRLADAHATSPAATYMYEFAWRSPQFNGCLGACHGLEIAFVFDTLGNRTEPLWGTNPPQQLADTMHTAWVAFASRGDPGWPKYELSRRATMRFDTTSEVVDDPRSAERALWEGLR